MSLKKYAFWIDEELLGGLRLVMERDGVKQSEQIRRGIRMWLKSKGVIRAERGRPRRRTRGGV